MKIYLVGGAVRDKLLGLPVKERDWVVVGATPEQMIALGYTQVGKDFPVFLHPETREEYALARTERKSGHGYTGFTFHTDPHVTLEQDLQRRDLTINAMAEDSEGNLIDPYDGQKDLRYGLLRHVSTAFIEDPLRVLRIARFNAYLAEFGFHVAPETELLLQQITASGELDHLVPERVWAETQKALKEKYPSSFFAVLHDCGALAVIFPEWRSLFTDDNMLVLQQTVSRSTDYRIRFACLAQFILPENMEQLSSRLRVDTYTKTLALAVSRWHTVFKASEKNSPEDMLLFFNGLDVWRRPELFNDFLLAYQPDTTIQDFWLGALSALKKIDIAALTQQYQGKALGDAIYQARLTHLKEYCLNL